MKKIRVVPVIMALMLVLSACQSGVTDVAPEEQTPVSANTETVEAVEQGTEENSASESQAASEENATSSEAMDEESTAAFPVRDEKIPPYAFDLLDGSTIKLDEFEGKVLVLTFFTTWCSYCEKEIPELQKQYEEMDDLAVIGIDVKETEKELTPYLERHGVTFPVVMDEDGQISQLFYVTGFPTTVFISPEGTLVGSVPGYLEKEQLLGYIDYTRTYQPETPSE